MFHRGATTIADWLGLGQQWVRLRAGWHWLYQAWRKFLAASHRSHPYSPPATKTLPRKPVTRGDMKAHMSAAIHVFLFSDRKMKLIPTESLEIFEQFRNCDNTQVHKSTYSIL